jgi:2-hydroxychromene-2-carboxylate isomerase
MSELPGRLRALLGTRFQGDVYLSTTEAAQLTGRSSTKDFVRWARRHGVPLRRPAGGRVWSVKQSDLDQVLGKEPRR